MESERRMGPLSSLRGFPSTHSCPGVEEERTGTKDPAWIRSFWASEAKGSKSRGFTVAGERCCPGGQSVNPNCRKEVDGSELVTWEEMEEARDSGMEMQVP